MPWQWYRTPAATSERNLTFAVREPRGGNIRSQTVLVLHASSGFSMADMKLADNYAAQGFTAVVGEWFYTPHGFSTHNAPTFTGQSWAAVNDVSALVRATRRVTGQAVAIVGVSRGASVAALRAAQGHEEPVALLSCLCTSPLRQGWGAHSHDDFPTRHASGIAAPVSVWSAADDAVTPVNTQQRPFVNALRASGNVPRFRVYPHGGHGGAHEVFVADSSRWIAQVTP